MKPLLNKSAFFEDLGYKPHRGQQLVHNSDAPRRVLACGVRWGKSTCAAWEAVAAAMEPRERSIGWVCAPTYDLADKVFREIVILTAEHLRHRIVTLKEGERKVLLRNMAGGLSEIRAKSADNPVSLLGEGLDWLIVDEASRLKPVIWEGHLSQRLLDKKGWALLISTPKGKGWFYDAFRRGQRKDDQDWESWNSPSWDNPILDKDMIEAERDRLPDRVFLQEYGAEFLEGAGQVFRNVRECATGEFRMPGGSKYYAGLDLAKVADYTVLVIMNAAREVVYVDRFHRLDWSQQIDRIKVATMKYGALTHVDSTGPGEPVFESIKKAGIRAVPYKFTSTSKKALIDRLALAFEEKRIVIPKYELWPEGIDELEAFEYEISDSGNIKMNAPSGQHDDCVIALALAAWPIARERVFDRELGYGMGSAYNLPFGR